MSIGTSLPELATNVYAAFQGESAVAIGNVTGSNVANVLLILGVAASFSRSIPIDRLTPHRDGTILMIILFLVLRYVLAWITYYNNLDSRLGQSTWRLSYDYPVLGKRDISDLDDKKFVRLRRKKNEIITYMYSIVLIMFIALMSLLSKFLIFFLT